MKVPIFFTFGARGPFIPGTAFNGMKDLPNDIIVPLMAPMTIAGNVPTLKIFHDAADFIHTDDPVKFYRHPRAGLR
jgi:hypothetical protein